MCQKLSADWRVICVGGGGVVSIGGGGKVQHGAHGICSSSTNSVNDTGTDYDNGYETRLIAYYQMNLDLNYFVLLFLEMQYICRKTCSDSVSKGNTAREKRHTGPSESQESLVTRHKKQ